MRLHEERYITSKKARSAVRLAINDFKDTIRAVMAIAGLAEKVRFERQMDDLDYLYADILERMKKSRAPVGAEKTQAPEPDDVQDEEPCGG